MGLYGMDQESGSEHLILRITFADSTHDISLVTFLTFTPTANLEPWGDLNLNNQTKDLYIPPKIHAWYSQTKRYIQTAQKRNNNNIENNFPCF